MILKRYLVFVFPEYYPAGGWDDLIGSFDTIEECKSELGKQEHSGCYAHIIDREIGEECGQ